VRTFGLFLLLCLASCSPATPGDNPRDRKGAEGALTWRAVSDADGQAAFLSRPGAAPDLVLWCRNNGLLTLRAHIFVAPEAQPNLILVTDGGILKFENVRRQGGVRAGDRKLVEGAVSVEDTWLQVTLSQAANLKVTSGDETFEAKNADPTNILPAFSMACAAANTKTKGKS
jgi:hypothetical protein